MSLPQTNIYTIEDIYSLPEGQRAELIDGQIYYMAPPKACLKIHSRQPHAPLCGFAPYSVAVARYSALMRNKSPTNCDARLT